MSYGNYGNKGQQNGWQNNGQQGNGGYSQKQNSGYNNNQNRGYNNQGGNNQQGGDKKQSVGGLWVRKMKNGSDFFSIIIDGKKYIAFPNNYKTEDKHPDFKLYDADDNNGGQQHRPQAPNQQQGTYAKQPANNNGYGNNQNNGYGNRPAQGNNSYSAPVQQQAPTQQPAPQQNQPSVSNEEFDDIPTF